MLEPGAARLAYLDAVVGVLRSAGFSLPDVAHAFGALDSHLYGFTMQVASWPFDVADYPQVAEEAAAALDPEAVSEPRRDGVNGRDAGRRSAARLHVRAGPAP